MALNMAEDISVLIYAETERIICNVFNTQQRILKQRAEFYAQQSAFCKRQRSEFGIAQQCIFQKNRVFQQ